MSTNFHKSNKRAAIALAALLSALTSAHAANAATVEPNPTRYKSLPQTIVKPNPFRYKSLPQVTAHPNPRITWSKSQPNAMKVKAVAIMATRVKF